MAMPLPGVIGQQIADDLGSATSGGLSMSEAQWTKIVTHLQAMIQASTVTVTVPALGLISPGGMVPAPVTGAANGTGTIA